MARSRDRSTELKTARETQRRSRQETALSGQAWRIAAITAPCGGCPESPVLHTAKEEKRRKSLVDSSTERRWELGAKCLPRARKEVKKGRTEEAPRTELMDADQAHGRDPRPTPRSAADFFWSSFVGPNFRDFDGLFEEV